MKTILITGPTSGIGKATAFMLAAQGHHLVLLARDEKKVSLLKYEILLDYPQTKIDIVLIDLASLASVIKAAEEIKTKFPKIDVLLNNAGGIVNEKQTTVDGYEYTFAMNHLGHFALTNALIEQLKANTEARVINVSSEAHKMGKLDFSDLMFDKAEYSAAKAYGNAKLCNIYFTNELADRLKGTGITVNALHPGVVNTGFGNDLTGFWKGVLAFIRPFMRTPEKGAETSVYLATSDEVKGKTAGYYKDKKLAKTTELAQDRTIGKKLWDVSEQLLHIF
jgi:NAD(P)-dependent dehydrogenase (short-subunit alcohol dehydrogenase family)